MWEMTATAPNRRCTFTWRSDTTREYIINKHPALVSCGRPLGGQHRANASTSLYEFCFVALRFSAALFVAMLMDFGRLMRLGIVCCQFLYVSKWVYSQIVHECIKLVHIDLNAKLYRVGPTRTLDNRAWSLGICTITAIVVGAAIRPEKRTKITQPPACHVAHRRSMSREADYTHTTIHVAHNGSKQRASRVQNIHQELYKNK
eukprot:m.1027107 g.1027107  ORF g.1027107 m.1027107 type:complete len:203 (-) comp24108_c0_seq68:1535-2143(-)